MNNIKTDLEQVHFDLLNLLKVFKTICEKEGIWYTLAFGSVLGAIRHNGFIPWDSDADVVIRLEDVEKLRAAFAKHKPKGVQLKCYNRDNRNTKSHDTLCFESEGPFKDLHLDIYPLIGAPMKKDAQIKVQKRNYFLDRIFRSKYVNVSDCLEKNRKKVYVVKLLDNLIPDSFIRRSIRNREKEFAVTSSNYLTCLASPYLPVPKECWNNIVLMPFEDTEFYVPGNWDLYLSSLYGDYMKPKKY